MMTARVFHQRSAGVILFLSAMFIGAFVPHQGFAADVVLSWDEIRDGAVSGYSIYYGTASRMYSGVLTSLPQGAATVTNGRMSYMVSFNAAPDTVYYFTVACYDSSGNRSGYSNEVQWRSPSTSGGAGPSAPMSVTVKILRSY